MRSRFWISTEYSEILHLALSTVCHHRIEVVEPHYYDESDASPFAISITCWRNIQPYGLS